MPHRSLAVVRFLRSRRLAVGLILGLAAYAVVATFVPRGAASDAAVKVWAAQHPVAEAIAGPLGLHGAFSSPLFLALAILLAASTAACAVERTRRARTLWRSTLHISDSYRERLRTRPQAAFPIAPEVEPEVALAAAADGLASLGLKTHAEDEAADGRSGVIGLLGSPVFHWALVALFVVVAAGQATRSEGFVALPLDTTVPEVHASYRQITEGPLFGERHTGVELKAIEIDHAYSSGGVDYGPTPVVNVSQDGVEIAGGRVHANSPLRVGSLMIHAFEIGPSVTLSLESSVGPELGRQVFALDRSADTSSGTKYAEFVLPAESGGQEIKGRVQVLTYRKSETASAEPVVSRALLEIAPVGTGGFGSPVVVAEGDAIDLSDGRRLRVSEVSDWALITVANDWSVPFIYGLLVLATLGLSLAVLVPTRRASVMLVHGDDGHSLHLGTWHARGDSLFKKRAIEVVRAAAGEVESQ